MTALRKVPRTILIVVDTIAPLSYCGQLVLKRRE